MQVAELERRAIAAAMAANDGNKLATSRMLGISRATLYAGWKTLIKNQAVVLNSRQLRCLNSRHIEAA